MLLRILHYAPLLWKRLLLATAQALCAAPSPSLYQASGGGWLSLHCRGSGHMTLLLFFVSWRSSKSRKNNLVIFQGLRSLAISPCVSLLGRKPSLHLVVAEVFCHCLPPLRSFTFSLLSPEVGLPHTGSEYSYCSFFTRVSILVYRISLSAFRS